MTLLGDSLRPRRSLDIRVGKFHILEVLLHVRHADWKYWHSQNQQDDDNDTTEGDIRAEFLELLHERIIPRMFGTELEAYHRAKHPGVLPPEGSDYYGDALTTSKKKKGNAKKRAAAAAPKGKKGQSKNNSSNSTSTASTTATSKKKKTNSGAAAATAVAALEDEDGAEKPEKDVYFSFGDTIQLSYRREPTTSCRTIFFQSKEDAQKDDDNNNNKSMAKSSGFKDYIKLSHRLVIWISRIDPDQKTNPDPKGVGFYRPEMIPMSSLFRQPKDVLLGDDDDDDDD